MSQKYSHYQIHDVLQKAKELGITDEQLQEVAPNLTPYLEAPSATGSGGINAGNRIATLAGNFAKAITTPTAPNAPNARYGLSPEQRDYIQDSQASVTNSVEDYLSEADNTYAPQTFYAEKYEAEPFSLGNLYNMALEQGISSAADIALMGTPVGMAAYGISESQRLADERAENDGRKGGVNTSDRVIGAATAGANLLLERVGAEHILPNHIGNGLTKKIVDKLSPTENPFIDKVTDNFGEGIDLTRHVATDASPTWAAIKGFGRGALVEGSTEYLQESLEYAGTNVGTEEGFDIEEMHNRGVMGATVGGMVGSHLGAGNRVMQRIGRDRRIDQLNQGYNETLDGLRQQGYYSSIDDKSLQSTLANQQYADSYSQAGEFQQEAPNLDGQTLEAYQGSQQGGVVEGNPDLKGLMSVANEIDPEVTRFIRNAGYDDRATMEALTHVVRQDEVYNELRDYARKPELDAARESTQLEHDKRQSEYDQFYDNTQTYLDAEQRRFAQAERENLNDQRLGLRPNVMFTLARQQEQKQAQAAQQQQDIKENVLSNVESNQADSNFAGMSEREQKVKTDSNSRKWQSMAKSVKSKRKRIKKLLRQQQADKRLSLQLDRMYNRLEQQEKNRKEEIEMQEWEKTKLAKQFKMAEAAGIDKEFNKLAMAVRDGIAQLPQEIQEQEAQKAEQAITEWVKEEYANSGSDTDGRSASPSEQGEVTNQGRNDDNAALAGSGLQDKADTDNEQYIGQANVVDNGRIPDGDAVSDVKNPVQAFLDDERDAPPSLEEYQEFEQQQTASQEAVSVSEPKKAPSMEEDHIYSSTTPEGKTIVKGDTYKQKDAIKAKGAKWDKDRKGWVFDKAEDAAEFVNSDGDTHGKSQAVKQAKYAIASGKKEGDVWVNERKNVTTEVEVRDDKVIIGKTKRIGKKTEETSQEFSLKSIKEHLSDDEVSKLEALKGAKDKSVKVEDKINKGRDIVYGAIREFRSSNKKRSLKDSVVREAINEVAGKFRSGEIGNDKNFVEPALDNIIKNSESKFQEDIDYLNKYEWEFSDKKRDNEQDQYSEAYFSLAALTEHVMGKDTELHVARLIQDDRSRKVAHEILQDAVDAIQFLPEKPKMKLSQTYEEKQNLPRKKPTPDEYDAQMEVKASYKVDDLINRLDKAGNTAGAKELRAQKAQYKGRLEDNYHVIENVFEKLEQDFKNNKEAENSKPKPSKTTLHQAFVKAIEESNIPKNSLEVRKFIAQFEGKEFNEVTKLDEQKAQEVFEVAMTQYARKLAKGNRNRPKYVVDMLTAKYMAQPNLNVMTGTTSSNMAYSTPAPISYMANLVTGITKETKVTEPTAGNGLLLIENGISNTTVNELDPERAGKLEYLGYKDVTNHDATNTDIVEAGSQDVAIMNPPFGKAKESYMASSVDGLDYKLDDLDHIIAAKQLESIHDNGNAVLIMGANREAGMVRGGKTGRFMNWLYSNYNVVDHVEVDGKVYKKQGAEWPIRVITIHGRKNTGQYAPENGSIDRLTGKDAKEIIGQLYDRYASNGLLDTADPSLSRNAGASNADLQNGSGQAANNAINSDSGAKQDIQPTNEPASSAIEGQATSSGNAATGRNNGSVVSNGGNSDTSNSGDNSSRSESGKQTLVGASAANRSKDNNKKLKGRNPESIIRDLESETDSAKSSDLQSKYKTASAGFNQGVLTPVNMAGKTRKALSNLTFEVGDIDPYLANELGYESVEKLHKALSALQIDAAALSINKIKQGKAIIVADQTGVGKGRQAAAIIRYALKQGKTPIFVTQKANLFSDMYGDLKDIDSGDVRPFIFNNGESITDGKDSLYKTTKGLRDSGFESLVNGEMPTLSDDKPANALFLTYDQFSTENIQREALNGIADNAILILDESHTAAGADAKRGVFLRGLLSKVKGAMYLSATFAKRPDNLGLYHLTSLGDAVENMEQLQDALSSGGLQLQTLVSAMLSEEGELIRREKSFEGININNVVDSENKQSHSEKFNRSTEILRDIVKLGKSFVAHIKQVNKSNKQAAEFKANTNVDKLNPFMFSSVVHNYVSQLTMAIKAESSANKALEAIKEGKRPVIALESTLETKLDEYMAENGLSNGDSVSDFTFGDMFAKGLLNAISLSKKLPNGDTEKVPYSFSELPANLYKQYQGILSKIDAVDLSDIPISPIDYIRKKIEDAGYSVEEVTGRKRMVDYSDNLKVVEKPASESKANRRKIIDRFNGAKTDVLILNQSGSTGLSIHASEKFEDQRPRHMIVAQPSLDINTFMQMLGRINRTGQVVLPSYDVLWLDLPSENRPATVVSNKMKGLNANTSANTDSATSIDSMDIFNKYGDEIVFNYLQENPEFLTEMSVKESDVMNNADNLAQFITGKLALLPVNKQAEFYNDVEATYKEHIEHLKATGEYALETQMLNLDAKPVSQTILSKGEGKSVFDGDIKLTYADVKSQGKPPSPDEFKAVFESADKDAVSKIFDKANEQFDKYLDGKYESKIAEVKESIDNTKDSEERDSLGADLSNLLESRRQERQASFDLSSLLGRRMREGSPIKLDFSNGDSVYGVVKAVKHSHKGKGNPLSKSKFKVQILTASGIGNLTVPLSKLMGEKGQMASLNHIDQSQMLSIAKSEHERPQREKRYIVTGNLIKAFSMVEDGRVVNFTKKGGGNEIGLLMPKKFKPENISKKNYAKDFDSVFKYLNHVHKNTVDYSLMSLGVSNIDGLKFSVAQRTGEMFVNIPVNNKELRERYLTDEMSSIIGEELVYRKGDKSIEHKIDKEQGKRIFDIGAALQPYPMKGSQLDTFNEANNIDDEFQKVSGSDIRFSTEGAVSTKKRPAGITIDDLNTVVDTMTQEFNGNMPRVITKSVQQELYGAKATTDKYGFIKGGYSNNGQPTIGLVASNMHSKSDARRVIRHELVGHYGFSILPEATQKDIISRIKNSPSKAVKAEWDRLSQDGFYGGQDQDIIAEEVFAHIIESGQTKFQSFLNGLLNLIRKGLKAVGLINKDAVSKSELHELANQIAKKIRSGEKPTDPNGGGTKFRLSDSQPAKKAKNFFRSMADKARDAKNGVNELGFMMVNQIVEQHEKKFKEGKRSHLREYYYHLNDSDAYRSDLANKAEKEIEEVWDKVQSEHPDETEKMSNLMIDATMNRLDPSMALVNQSVYMDEVEKRDELVSKMESIEETISRTGRQSVKQASALTSMGESLVEVTDRIGEIESTYNNLQSEYNALPEENKELFEAVRDFYKFTWDETKEAIEERIRQLKLEDSKQADAMQSVDLMFRNAIEKGVYFPLARFGKHVVIARDTDGNLVSRMHFESESEANRVADKLEADGYDVTPDLLVNTADYDQANVSQFAKKIIANIDEMGKDLNIDISNEQGAMQIISEQVNDLEIMDMIYQAMLQTLPTQSAAKSLIHRKYIEGASKDSRRAFSNAIFHQSFKIAKIKYEHKMTNSINAMEEMVKSKDYPKDKKKKARQVHEKIAAIHMSNMNPNTPSWVSKLTNAAFFFHLSGSPAAGILNTTQTWLVGVGELGSRYGMADATKELAKATAEYNKVAAKGIDNFKFSNATKAEAWISLVDSGYLKGKENDIIKALHKEGDIEITQAQMLAQIAETDMQNGAKLSRGWIKTSRALGSFFHNAEIYNREVTALAAIRLHKKKKPEASERELKEVGRRAIKRIHFDYGSSNRALWMRGNAKAFLVFKQYSQNIIYLMADNLNKMVKGETPEVRKQAGTAFGTMMIAHMIAGGYVALPLASTVLSLLSGLVDMLDGEDEERNLDAEIRSALHEVNPTLSDMMSKGVVNALSPIDLSTRVKLDGLVYRSPERELSVTEYGYHIASEIAGAGIGTIVQVAGAVQTMGEGFAEDDNKKVWRGFEKLWPKFVRDPLKAGRRELEGERNYADDPVMGEDEFGLPEFMGQFIGFGNSDLSDIYDKRTDINNYNKRLSGKRKLLMTRYYNAIIKGNPLEDVMADIVQFNMANPEYMIQTQDLVNSFKARTRRNQQTDEGVYVPKSKPTLRDLYNY